MRSGLALALLLLATPAVADPMWWHDNESYRPSPRAGELVGQNQTPSTNNAQKAAEDQRGTEKAPLVVKVQNPTKTQREAEQDPDYRQRKAADDRIARLTIVGIIVGAAQAVALFITFCVIAFVAIRQLRAYVFIETAQICAADVDGKIIQPPALIAEGTRPVSAILFKNFGQTPARGFTFHGAGIALAAWPFDPTNWTPATPPTGSTVETLGPGATRKKFDIPPEAVPVLNARIIEDLRKGDRAIFVYGEVRYRDVFGLRRYTKYRLFIGGPTGLRGTSLAAHDEGNEAK
jgi:hypothetical protein